MKRRRFIRNTILLIIFVFILNSLRYAVNAESKIHSNSNISILVDISEERLYLIDTEKNIILKNIQ